MSQNESQKAKAEVLKQLHRGEDMLVLPNIWEPLGASLLEQLGFPAVATGSASVAFCNGYDDGEKIPFSNLLHVLKSIVGSVSVPVTADIESGYAADNNQLEEKIKEIIHTGVAGINFEDTDKQSNKLIPVEIQCEKIRLIRKVSSEMNVPLFINARADVYFRSDPSLSEEEKLQEVLHRGEAYISSGADCVFPIGLRNKDSIERLVSLFPHPINIMAMPGVPDLKTLKTIGVTRVSLGPGFLAIAIKAMQDTAIKLQSLEGLDEVTNNPVNMDFMRKLIIG